MERSIKLIKRNLNGPLAERKSKNEEWREGERERESTQITSIRNKRGDIAIELTDNKALIRKL